VAKTAERILLSQTDIRYIAIEGVIGVGKTSLAQMLGEKFGGRVVLERFEENPFLEKFYKDPERYAFQTQIFFLLSRYRQQQELFQADLFQQVRSFVSTKRLYRSWRRTFPHLIWSSTCSPAWNG